MSAAEHFMLCPESPSYIAWARDSPPGKGRKVKRGDYVVSQVAGYYSVRTQGVTYRMHRVVYELVHGECPALIDHRDQCRSNNHPDNLRPATVAANGWNRCTPNHNTSGVKGVWWDSARLLWVGQVTAAGSNHRTRNKDKAVVEEWVTEKRQALHGAFANNG